jgi:hypothetical protein
MKDDLIEVWIAAVTVYFPVFYGEVDLDCPSFQLSIDLDSRFGKIGSRPSIPVAKLNDLDALPLCPGKGTAEFSPEPLRLEGEFIPERKRRTPNDGEPCREDFFAKNLVTKGSIRERGLHRLVIYFTNCSNCHFIFADLRENWITTGRARRLRSS